MAVVLAMLSMAPSQEGFPGAVITGKGSPPPPRWSPSSQPQRGCCDSLQFYRWRHGRGMRQSSHKEGMAGITESTCHESTCHALDGLTINTALSVKLTPRESYKRVTNLKSPLPPPSLSHTHTSPNVSLSKLKIWGCPQGDLTPMQPVG